jgi:DNA-binding response OmpR family regulator
MRRLPHNSILVVASADRDARAVVDAFARNDLGACVRIARTADEAVALIRGGEADCAPRLVLLDLGLHDGAAVKLARELQTDRSLRGVPVIALVSSADDAEAPGIGGVVTGTVVKPFEFAAFLRTVSAFSLYWRAAARDLAGARDDRL